MNNVAQTKLYNHATKIAEAYKAVGLYSIPLLTVVTIISMSNVFTAGTFAHWPYVSTVWAVIFSIAIDVNIVRLFVEANIEKSKAAFWIGLGLCIVTGAALFIEGIEQSVGITWNNQLIHTALTILIGCRVILVIILMAREGTRLGNLLQISGENPANLEPKTGENQGEIEPKNEHEEKPVVSSVEPTEEVQNERNTDQLETVKIQYTKLTPLQASALPICEKNNITSSAIRSAIKSRELKANAEGKVSRNAVENWVKSRKKTALKIA